MRQHVIEETCHDHVECWGQTIIRSSGFAHMYVYTPRVPAECRLRLLLGPRYWLNLCHVARYTIIRLSPLKKQVKYQTSRQFIGLLCELRTQVFGRAHRWQCLVVLHSHHYFVLHGKLGCIFDHRTNADTDRISGRSCQTDWDIVRNFGRWVHQELLQGIILMLLKALS
jgi:hypothetical protein